VSDPEFSRDIAPSLQMLDGAADEGAKIAAIYGTSALSGAAATRSAVIEQLKSATMFHYAGHAIANDVDARNSYLLLAPDEISAGLLYVRDIERLDLTRLDVAVLAGCSTASTSTRLRHPLGIAAGFLAAGARTVVATIWDTDDALTRRFSADLHQRMVRGDEPTEAVRNAQIAFLHSPDERIAAIRSWAQFQVWIA
jgi:CHAT domain-containing protein